MKPKAQPIAWRGAAAALLLAALAALAAQAGAPQQPPPDGERGYVALDQAARDLTNPYTLVAVAAREEFIDAATLAHHRKRLGARTVILLAEGGAGNVTPEASAALGAARRLGADLLFLDLPEARMRSPEEVIGFWGRDETLRRLTLALRELRADIVVTDPNATDPAQQAAARLAAEAVRAAGDAERWPAEGEPWTVRRFALQSPAEGAQIRVPVDLRDEARGLTYTEIAGAARRAALPSLAPRLQTPTTSAPGAYRVEGGEVAQGATSLLEGLTLPENLALSVAPPRVGDQSLLAALARGDRLVPALQERLLEKRAEGTIADLRQRYGAEFFRVIRYTENLERLLALALGLQLRVELSDLTMVQGQRVMLRMQVRNGGDLPVPLVFRAPAALTTKDESRTFAASDVQTLMPGAALAHTVNYEVPGDEPLTAARREEPDLRNYYPAGAALAGALAGLPFGDRLPVYAEIGLGTTTFSLPAQIGYEVVAPVEIDSIPFALVRDWSKPGVVELPVRLRNRMPGPLNGALWVVPLALADDSYAPLRVAFTGEDQTLTARLRLRLPILKPPLTPDLLIEFRRDPATMAPPLGSLTVPVRAGEFDADEGLVVGYVGGDWLSFALSQFGDSAEEVRADELFAADYAREAAERPANGCADLSRFDAIVVDEDALASERALTVAARCLLEYARGGGTLIVLAQPAERWHPADVTGLLAPQAFRLETEVKGEAEVSIVEGENPLVARPNRISTADLEALRAARAEALPADWPEDYRAPAVITQAGEPTRMALLLATRYGEGGYVYAGYRLRREALAGNPAAFRLLANLVGFARSPR